MKHTILWVDRHKPHVLIPPVVWVYFVAIISRASRTVTFVEAAFWVTVIMVGVAIVGIGIACVIQGWGHLVAWAERAQQQIARPLAGDSLLREAEAEVENLLREGTPTPNKEPQ